MQLLRSYRLLVNLASPAQEELPALMMAVQTLFSLA